MSTLTAERFLTVEQPVCAVERVREQVWSLLSGSHSSCDLIERRAVQRIPYPNLVLLTPMAADGRTPLCESLVVVGKHLSEHGLGFFHPKPLPYRRIVASLRSTQGVAEHFLMEVNWCRFTEHGWYESGGRFLRQAADPRGT